MFLISLNCECNSESFFKGITYCVKSAVTYSIYNFLFAVIFKTTYLNISEPVSISEAHYKQNPDATIGAEVTIEYNGEKKIVNAVGNGRLDAVSNALKETLGITFTIQTYQEHALEKGSKSQAVAYVGITGDNDKTVWGAGVNSDIIVASMKALLSAVNKKLKA